MAFEIISSISIDMHRPNAEVVHAVQFDTADVIKIQLLDNGEKWYVPVNSSPAIIYKKSDRIGGYYDYLAINNQEAIAIDSNDRSIIYAYLDIQTTTTSGLVNVQVAFFNELKRLTAFSFVLDVQPSLINYADVTSQWIFNSLVKAKLITDKTLSLDGAAADAKETGNIKKACDLKINKPTQSPDGINGQILRSLGNGATEWANVGQPTDEQIASAITTWLEAHPEATTTVLDGSITLMKMHPDLRSALDYIEVTE